MRALTYCSRRAGGSGTRRTRARGKHAREQVRYIGAGPFCPRRSFTIGPARLECGGSAREHPERASLRAPRPPPPSTAATSAAGRVTAPPPPPPPCQSPRPNSTNAAPATSPQPPPRRLPSRRRLSPRSAACRLEEEIDGEGAERKAVADQLCRRHALLQEGDGEEHEGRVARRVDHLEGDRVGQLDDDKREHRREDAQHGRQPEDGGVLPYYVGGALAQKLRQL
mmetsp:Transcript_38720/g.113275  ORF Transcript_38720/g.113275 Transcript_38720/m.113275 type:complete len:225 (-) Transcript_38720:399-1073(-)